MLAKGGGRSTFKRRVEQSGVSVRRPVNDLPALEVTDVRTPEFDGFPGLDGGAASRNERDDRVAAIDKPLRSDRDVRPVVRQAGKEVLEYLVWPVKRTASD